MPPLVMLAVAVTLVPAQIVADGDTVTAHVAAGEGVTVIATVFDVAGELAIHVSLDVITQYMLAPLGIAALVTVELVAPETALPFIYH
jgi:hypothetical protein